MLTTTKLKYVYYLPITYTWYHHTLSRSKYITGMGFSPPYTKTSWPAFRSSLFACSSRVHCWRPRVAQLHIGTTSGPQPRSCLPRHRSWSPSHLYGYQHHQQQQSDIPTQQSTTLSQQLSFSLIVKKILCGYGLVLNLSKIKLKLSEFTTHTPSTQSFYIYLHFHDKNAEYVRFITRYVLYISRRSRKTLL